MRGLTLSAADRDRQMSMLLSWLLLSLVTIPGVMAAPLLEVTPTLTSSQWWSDVSLTVTNRSCATLDMRGQPLTLTTPLEVTSVWGATPALAIQGYSFQHVFNGVEHVATIEMQFAAADASWQPDSNLAPGESFQIDFGANGALSAVQIGLSAALNATNSSRAAACSGTLPSSGSTAPPTQAPSTTPTTTSAPTTTSSSTTTVTPATPEPVTTLLDGAEHFQSSCVACHKPAAEGGSVGGDLRDERIRITWEIEGWNAFVDKVTAMNSPNCDADCVAEVSDYLWYQVWGLSNARSASQVVTADGEQRGVRGLRLLTPLEYRNSVRDLIGVELAESDLPNYKFDAEFRYPTDADSGVVLYEDLLSYLQLAQQVAAQADLSRLGCAATQCSDAQLPIAAERLLRRSLSDEELGRYRQINSAYGSRDLLAALLISPNFLYRAELGEWSEAQQAYQLSDYEVASALSFSLWGTAPDAALLQKAAAGGFSDQAAVESEVAAMLADPRSADYFVEFIRFYSHTSATPTEKEGLTAELLTAMQQEQRLAIRALFAKSQSTIGELFNPGYTFVNSLLASHYGLGGALSNTAGQIGQLLAEVGVKDGSHGFRRVETARQRGGLLQQGIWQVLNADFAATSPVKRGKAIRENLMCHQIGVPSGVAPDDVVLPVVALSNRQRWDLINGPQATGGECWKCHQLMNEPGYALEEFDQNGRFRRDELAVNDANIRLPLDTSGTLWDNSGTTALIEYGDTRDVSDYLANSELGRSCFADSYYRFASGRSADLYSRNDLQQMQQSFVDSGDIKELMAAMFRSGSFLYRLDREIQ